MISDDNGQSWQAFGSMRFTYAILCNNGDIIAAESGNSNDPVFIWRSKDNGQTWAKCRGHDNAIQINSITHIDGNHYKANAVNTDYDYVEYASFDGGYCFTEVLSGLYYRGEVDPWISLGDGIVIGSGDYNGYDDQFSLDFGRTSYFITLNNDYNAPAVDWIIKAVIRIKTGRILFALDSGLGLHKWDP